jgi:hypothetical protein
MTNEMVGRFESWAAAVQFILAGNAYVTLKSLATETRYTYRVSRADCKACGEGKECTCGAVPRFFVSTLIGSDNENDYVYLGMIGNQAQFRATKATGDRAKAKPFLAFEYAWKNILNNNRIPAQLEIWHEGRCGRCGRKLTVPESVAAGIGPDCAGKMGGGRKPFVAAVETQQLAEVR